MDELNHLGFCYRRIKNYEDYFIGENGNVISFKNKFKFMKKQIRSGYESVMLSNKEGQKRHSIHRLVALSFIKNKYGKPQINHINENKLDNNVKNLEWVTAKENNNHGTRNKRAKKSMINGKNSKIVLQIKNNEIIKKWSSTRELERNGYDRTTICRCCKGFYKKYKNFNWRYEEDILI